MKTAIWLAGGTVAVLLWLAGRVVSTLITDQIRAWLPGLMRRLVSREAKKMGPDSARFEEEWLADIEQTPGDLAKLWLVLPLVFVPARTALERWSDSPERLKNLAARAVLDYGWLTVVGAFVWTCVQYPPRPIYSAAYRVLVPLVGCAVLALSRHLRSALRSLYEDKLGYRGRVCAGASVVPLLMYIIVSWTLVPPRDSAATAVTVAAKHERPTAFPVHSPPPPAPAKPTPAVRSVLRTDAGSRLIAQNQQVAQVEESAGSQLDEGGTGLQHGAIARYVARAFRAAAAAEPPDGALGPRAEFPAQPIPRIPTRSGAPPAAPSNVRLGGY